MPRSRTTSPIPGPDISRSFVPGLTLTHSNNNMDANDNYYNRTPASNDSFNNNAQPAHKKHKYVKPRIGSSFQAKVEPFDESIAKATIQERQLERRRGVSSINGGSGSNNDSVGTEGSGNGIISSSSSNDTNVNVAGEEYGSNGGIFAVPSSSSSMNGYGACNNKRKKAGRPAKNAKLNRANNIFQNFQPIHYDPILRPPNGGLCIHRPTHYDESTCTTNARNSGDNDTAADHFLTFARNIMLQTPYTKQDSQSSYQYSAMSQNSRGFKRIDHLFNSAVKNKGYGDGNIAKGGKKKSNNGNVGSGGSGGTAKLKRGRKRKCIDLVRSTCTDTVTTDDALNETTTRSLSPPTPPISLTTTVPVATANAPTATAIAPVTNTNVCDDSSSSVATASIVGDSSTNMSLMEESNSISAATAAAAANTATYRETALGLEDDEYVLEYLQRNHNGNVKRAQFHLLSDLCRGRAVKTRRHHKKIKKEDEMNVPLSAVLAPLSDSWRRRYERMGSSSTILGDCRDQRIQYTSFLCGGKPYPFFTTQRGKHLVNSLAGSTPDVDTSDLYPWMQQYEKGKTLDTVQSANGYSSQCKVTPSETLSSDILKSESTFLVHKKTESVERDEELMKIWKSILDSGQSVIASTSSKDKDNQKLPTLRDLLILLSKAYSLPKPEDVFGRRDSISKQISQSLNSILDRIEQARGVIAHLADAIYDDDGSGVEINKVQKILDRKSAKCTIHVEEVDITRKMLEEALSWEAKLSQPSPNDQKDDSEASEDLSLPQQSLANVEELALRGRSLSLRPRSLVVLDNRVQRAYELRNKIRGWSFKNNNNDKDSVKYVASMIKEANQINLGFPELSILSKVHRNAEEWVDRANVALRSKISLHELETLVETGQKLPLGLTGTLEKLMSRFKQACEWIDSLRSAIPCPMESMNETGSNIDADDLALWLSKMLKSIQKDGELFDVVNNLSAEGSRLPVETNIVQILQTAIESRNWSVKAKKWIPSPGDQYKRGKIEDLREHLEAATVIVQKANRLTDGKSKWSLDFEEELSLIVHKSDEWYKKYQIYLEGDNRRVQGRQTLTYTKLEQIVNEANQIAVNLGSSFVKINRMYSEAKCWIDKNRLLLSYCGLQSGNNIYGMDSDPQLQKHKLSIDDVNGAIEAAAKDLTVDLDEVRQLKDLASQSQDWFDRALEFAPKRNKRIVRGKKDSPAKHSIQEVITLINIADNIPMDTTKELERLRMLLSDVQAWRLQSQVKLREIINTFDSLRQERVRYYGLPGNFLQHFKVDTTTENHDPSKGHSLPIQSDAPPLNDAQSDSEDSLMKSPSKSSTVGGGKSVYKLVASLCKSAESIQVYSIEEQISEKLDIASRWCKKAALLIASHTDVYTNKRWRKDLETLIHDGESFQIWNSSTDPLPKNDDELMTLLSDLKKSVSSFMSNDIERLKILCIHRDNYYTWCDKASKAYTEVDKKIPLEALKSLAEESLVYPQNAETVKQVRKDAANAVAWVETVSEIIKSGKKISLSEARTRLDAGNRLKFTCSEYKDLRKAYQAAKAWSKRVKKSGLDEGSAHIYKIKELIKEHDSFLISMPEEIDALNQALCAYCICRRPYEGFMIGCDDCEEWYHGACIGVSQAQGNKIDKYLCVRCCVKKVYKQSCNSIAAVTRKWCDPKERSKSRSQDSQKHLRKIREKKREIVKWKDELQANVLKLRELKAQEVNDMPQAHTASPNEGNPSCPQITEVNDNIARATTSLEQCNRRLEELAAVGKKRTETQQKEDTLEYAFQYWCIMLKTKVLAPKTKELSEKSRPIPSIACTTGGELLSGPMHEVIEAASKYGIGELPDVVAVKNSLECVSWCHFAFSVLRRKPGVDEVTALIRLSSIVKLPEVKSIGMMRSMISRTTPWQAKVTKALMPVCGETKPFDAAILTELRIGLNAIPLTTPQETILLHAIEDQGKRHCACGGPRDVTNMECCNHCGLWYHKSCFSLSGSSENDSKCPVCQKPATAKLKNIDKTTIHDFSPHASDPVKVWPPFGLAGSTEALKVLGSPVMTLQLEKMQEPKPPIAEQNICQEVSEQKDNIKMQSSSSSSIISNNRTSQQPTAVSKEKVLGNPFCMPLKRPSEAIDSPNKTFSPGTVRKTMDMNAPILDGNSLLNAKEVAESAVKAALSVNVNTSVLGVNSVLNVKDAAEVAVNAANMFKVVTNQPLPSIKTMQSESNNRPIITNPTYGIVSNTTSNTLTPLDNRPLQQTIREDPYKNATGLSFPVTQPSVSNASRTGSINRGNQAHSDIINTTAMGTTHHNISVTGKHSDKMSHLTPQAVVQTAPVKSTPKPSVLLKKFG